MKKRIERKGVLHFGKAWEGGLGMHDCFLFSGLAMDLKGCFFVGFFFLQENYGGNKSMESVAIQCPR